MYATPGVLAFHPHTATDLPTGCCLDDTGRVAHLTDTAITLRRWEYSETSQTVALLTRDHGIVRGLAKGAMRPGGAFSGGFEPMTAGHLAWIHKPARELATLTEWHLEEVYWPLRQDVTLNRAALYAIDLTSRLLNDHDPHREVHDALHALLSCLPEPPCPEFHQLVFQWSVLKAVGWRPCVEHDTRTGDLLPEDLEVAGFSSIDGGVIAHPIEGDHRVRRTTIDLLGALDRGDLCEVPDPTMLRRASALLAVYTRDLLGDQSEAMRLAYPEVAL